jgi:hypothetical protein
MREGRGPVVPLISQGLLSRRVYRMGDGMKVVPARAGAVGFDTDSPLTASLCESLIGQGYEFAIRYVSHTQPEAGDLSPAEVQAILGSGLALMVVVHSPAPGWAPRGVAGAEHATWAVSNLEGAGLRAVGAMTVWCDLEGVLPGTPASDIIDYVNTWTVGIRAAGYQPGLYVGYDAFLTGSQLYVDLYLARYWKSASAVPTPALRGFCMTQMLGAGPMVAAVQIDRDVIQADRLGGLPMWLVA